MSGPGITGWLLSFFPYITSQSKFEKNKFCWNGSWEDATEENGLGQSCFNYSLNKVPFKLSFTDNKKAENMLFLG